MRIGGSLDGVVTSTASAKPNVVVVEAVWGDRYARKSVSVERVGQREAIVVANAWADQLAAGRQPSPATA
jgi:hypothetical protein